MPDCVAYGTRRYEIQGSRDAAGKGVPAGMVAVVRSSDTLRVLNQETALATLSHQPPLTPSCGGFTPTAERTVGPARMIVGELDTHTQTRN